MFLVLASSTFAQKINGVNFVAERSFVQQNGFDDLKTLNAKWVAWIPYAFCEVMNGKLMHGLSWQWAGETKAGTIKAIELARKKGLKVMVKPHVWMSDHSFTGKANFEPEKWKEWQKGYSAYILDFARLAQENKVELFCLGTEHYSSISHDNQYWLGLIEEVRKVYKGKITYAANWDNYDKIPFWNKLDYIGVDAYFPLSDKSQPSIKELEIRWSNWKSKLEALSKANETPVLFTEYGYRCSQFNCKDPWVDVTEDLYCEHCQDNALNALYNSFWSEKWFAGGFLWKWFEANKSIRHESKKSYAVKGKLAGNSVAKAFKKTN